MKTERDYQMNLSTEVIAKIQDPFGMAELDRKIEENRKRLAARDAEQDERERQFGTGLPIY